MKLRHLGRHYCPCRSCKVQIHCEQETVVGLAIDNLSYGLKHPIHPALPDQRHRNIQGTQGTVVVCAYHDGGTEDHQPPHHLEYQCTQGTARAHTQTCAMELQMASSSRANSSSCKIASERASELDHGCRG